jgi:hypothetical protein
MNDEDVLALVRRSEAAAQAEAEMAERQRAVEEAEAEKKAERDAALAKAGPVAISGQGITINLIGLPELNLRVRNNTSNTVEAFEISADCFNKFDEPVNQIAGGNRFNGTQQYSLGPGEEKIFSWQLSLQRSAAKADAWIRRAKLSNGEVWEQTKEQASRIPRGVAKAKLIER